MIRPNRSKRSTRCRGSVLVLFALFVFVLAGIAALTVDLGIARLTQTQMQDATDGAALEGLRGRDDLPLDADLLRRRSAAQFVAWTFDDNLQTQDGDALDLGAGPTIDLSGGFGGDMHASQKFDLAASGPFKPRLELNLTNEIEGDLVAGDPVYSSAPTHTLEDGTYARADFDNVDHDSNARLDAFLVRLRRTNDILGLDQLQGVSTKGPPLPYLFGLATFFTSGGGQGVDVVGQGITLRATSIAAAGHVVDPAGNVIESVGRVLAAGPEDPASGRIGATSIALQRDFFANMLVVDVSAVLNYDATGAITFGGQVVGQFADVEQVGQVVQGQLIPTTVGPRVYVPVFDSVTGRDICTGFGYATVEAFDSSTVTLTKRQPIVAPANASGILARGFAGLTSAEFTQVLQAGLQFDPWSLRAPVLIR